MLESDAKEIRQPEASSIPNRLWDAVIVGAGPAGAAAATHLAARHHRVLLLDRKRFPREKVCGDGILSDALRCLDTIGLGDKIRSMGRRISACSLFSPSRHEVVIRGEYLALKRYHLDTIIAKKAAATGAFFACGEVKQIQVDPNGLVSFTLHGGDQRYRARIGILATGANFRLLRRMNWPVQKKPSAVALRCYVRSTVGLDRFIVSYDRSTVPGYAWIFPLRNHEYNLGCGIRLHRYQKTHINLKKMFHNFIDSFPLARELMRQSDQITALQAGTLRNDFEGAYPYVNGPIVAVGETIGTTLPFLGEGIGKAMESGEMAAEAVSAALDSNDPSRLNQYSQKVESELKPRYHGYRTAEKWVARPWLNDVIFGRFGSRRYTQEILAGVISETKRPQEIFSLKGMLKAFFK
jgi:geranylgeranyl reductase family protein